MRIGMSSQWAGRAFQSGNAFQPYLDDIIDNCSSAQNNKLLDQKRATLTDSPFFEWKSGNVRGTLCYSRMGKP
jgi:hypothetical protein